jgi:hypothetical protein
MPKLFLSYRRTDTQMVAGRLRQSLVGRFGEEAVFRDKDSIAAGEDWTRAIREGLTGEVVVLALIGHDWAGTADAEGRRRLDDPTDWNRVELEQALTQGGRVIPVLVDGTQMPRESDLPESLRPLTHLNALKLRDDDWEPDVERLLRAVGPKGIGQDLRMWAAVGVLALVVAVATYWWLGNAPPPPPDERGTERVNEFGTLAGGI